MGRTHQEVSGIAVQTIMEQMRAAIRAAGIKCYGPDVKPGACTSPYAVVYDGGTTPQPGTRGMLGHLHINVMVLAPAAQDALLTSAVNTVRTALKSVQRIRASGELSPIDTDQERRAVYQTTDYTLPTRL